MTAGAHALSNILLYHPWHVDLSFSCFLPLIANWLLQLWIAYLLHTSLSCYYQGKGPTVVLPCALLTKFLFRSLWLKVGPILIFCSKGYWESQHRVILIG